MLPEENLVQEGSEKIVPIVEATQTASLPTEEAKVTFASLPIEEANLPAHEEVVAHTETPVVETITEHIVAPHVEKVLVHSETPVIESTLVHADGHKEATHVKHTHKEEAATPAAIETHVEHVVAPVVEAPVVHVSAPVVEAVVAPVTPVVTPVTPVVEAVAPPVAPVAPAAVEAIAAPSAKSTQAPIRVADAKKATVIHRHKDAQAVEEEEEIELVLEPEAPELGAAHDDFDWSKGRRNEVAYTDAERKDFLEQYDATLSAVAANAIVKGRVSAVSGGDVVLDINAKSDGLVALSDFRDIPDLKIGDYVDVYVESQEDENGQLVLSRRKAKLLRSWEAILDSFQNGTIIRGQVISKTKGGLIVDSGGLETFLPGSQIDIKPITDYDQYIGKIMEFKVVKVNETIKNAVVSHKALIESDLAEQREHIIAGLEKGQVLEGTVKNITDFGAFLDLGGVDGLLYITDISWGRISHPSEALHMNQKVNVVVLDFDENKKRISLGLKQLQPHPWEVLDKTIAVDSIVKGRIVNIEDYGAFVEIRPGVEGLVHVSEVSWGNQPINAKENFKVGQEVEAKVVTLDRDDRKMSLSVKQLTSDPWLEIVDKFPVGSKHMGEVKNITQYGVFVELAQGVGGMVHISDLSWTKRYAHPNEFTKSGNKIEVVILDIDRDARKLSLGHKQVIDNPWDTFVTIFPTGSYHEGTVLRKDDRGATIQLQYGLEAFCPIKQLKKEDGNNPEIGDKLMFKIIEFNPDDKRVLVSHARYVEDIKREADDAVRKEKDAEVEDTRKAVKATNDSVEKATIGDLIGLAELKEKLEEK